VSQSFPLATTTMNMTAGQVVPSYIELKNVGSKTWDSNTRIGTTQPRDRVSVSPTRPGSDGGTIDDDGGIVITPPPGDDGGAGAGERMRRRK